MVEGRKLLLATTGLVDSWGSCESILLLGKWCIDSKNKEALSHRDYQINPSYIKDEKLLKEAYEEVNVMRQLLLKELAEELNAIHNKNYSLRYWEIVVGPWLYSFISSINHRWDTLAHVLNRDKLSSIEINFNYKEMVPFDNAEFIRMQVSHEWNHYIYNNLLGYFNITRINFGSRGSNPNIISIDRRNIKYRIFQLITKYINQFLLKKLVKKQKIFLLSTYLPIWDDIVLQLKNKQFPVIWQSINFSIEKKIDLNMRREFINNSLEKSTEDAKFTAIKKLVKEQIPTIYLENYHQLLNFSENIEYPKSPEKIFTSSCIITDEVFKIWAAANVEKGAKYYIGMNGGFYGTSKYKNVVETIGQNTSDRYLTWGWTDGNSKNYPTFMFKRTYKKFKYDKYGFLLVITCVDSDYLREPWERTIVDKESYLTTIHNILGLLKVEILNKSYIRLSRHDNYLEKKNYFDLHYPKVQVDNGDISISTLIQKARISLVTYNSTVMLENFRSNIPTVVHIDSEIFEPRDSALPLWEGLVRAKILFNDHELMVQHLNAIWDDVGGWWSSDETQSALKEFSNSYCNETNEYMKVLTSALDLN